MPERSIWETLAVVGVIGAISLLAAAFDLGGLIVAFKTGGPPAAARAIAAIGLGWMCGWYLTVKFAPTHSFLVGTFFAWAGHVVALVACVIGVGLMALVERLGTDPDQSTFLGMAAVTFVPVAAFFATQLSQDRSVHLVSGFGIGSLTYIVLFGVPG